MSEPTSTAERLKGDLSAHTPMMQQGVCLGLSMPRRESYAGSRAAVIG